MATPLSCQYLGEIDRYCDDKRCWAWDHSGPACPPMQESDRVSIVVDGETKPQRQSLYSSRWAEDIAERNPTWIVFYPNYEET